MGDRPGVETIAPQLSGRAGIAPAAGFRSLVAHAFGVLDPARVHEMAAMELGGLLEFCHVMSRELSGG